MKKQIATVITATFIFAGLTACSENVVEDQPVNFSSVNDSSTLESSVQSSDSQSASDVQSIAESDVQSTEESKSDMVLSETDTNMNYMFDPKITENTQRLIDEFTYDSFNTPDGGTINKSDAVYAIRNDPAATYGIGFDFSYIRYAKPIFNNSIDDPELVDWKNRSFKSEEYGYSLIDEPNYFKVCPGDKLTNGLTVKTANCWYGNSDVMYASNISFEGEWTLTGILHYDVDSRVPDDDYLYVYFYADPTQCDIPMTINDVQDSVSAWISSKVDFALVSDNVCIYLGELKDISVDLSDIPVGEYVKVKVTLKELNLSFVAGPFRTARATLVDVEII